jgi:hypothetical protein
MLASWARRPSDEELQGQHYMAGGVGYEGIFNSELAAIYRRY